ncbi:hypothetical protein DMN91_012069 [Ooceraea biroi]|uniref:THAP-type domain-containing protein n=3 Tax=Ooceraea biroi TaxID=2015173 RepID=A0A3L8D7N4_OOCBI|nr:hypothetical protein DMN91_012069 [Ooceraea biroi]
MRKLWILRTGRTQWNPMSTSCICENHFDVAQWEKVRTDGSRVLRRAAVPCLPEIDSENIENITPAKSHDDNYTSIARQPLQDIRNSIFVEEASSPISMPSTCDNQILLDQDLPFINNNTSSLEEVSFDSLFAFANICSNIEPLSVPPYNTNSTSPSKQELRALLKKQKEEIEALQREQETIKKIAIKCSKDYCAMKTRYDKCRLKLWRSEQSQAKSRLALSTRLHSDQLRVLQRQSKGGVKWSLQTIQDALAFKMKWRTTGFSDFVNYLPIFPSIRTLQRAVEHIRFESGILEEVFDMLQCTVSRMTENERDCMIAADEMTIRAGYAFDPSSKKIFGKCTFPTHVGQAKKVLVIVCAGICRRWKVVVAYFFTGNENPELKKQKANLSGIAFKDIFGSSCAE